MANVDAPFGFKVARHLSGGMPNRLSRYHIAPNLAANIYRGDAVIPVNTSKRITRPGAGDAKLLGVFNSCVYILPDGEPRYDSYWPTGQSVQTGSTPDAFVYDDPNLIFEVQASGAFAASGIGALADLSIGTGNPLTKVSGDEIDSTTIDTTGTVFKILDYVRRPDNEVGANAKLLVAISSHYLRGAMTTI